MSEYTDLKNNTYRINQSTLANGSQVAQSKEEIIEALYRIFDKR